MLRITHILYFVLFNLCLLSLHGHANNFRYYTISEGLSVNAVYSIMQDSKGRMWFGTIDGLHSFDGNQIQVWRDSQVKTLGPCIYTVFEHEQQLYVGSDEGLSVFNLCMESFSEFDVRTEAGEGIRTPVRQVTKDSKGNLWISTFGQGVFRFDVRQGKLCQYVAPGKSISDFVYSVTEDSSGTIWLATQDAGIGRYIPSKDVFQPIASNTVKSIRVIFEDSRNNLWAGSNTEGLFRLDKSKKQLVSAVKPFGVNRPLQVRKIVEKGIGVLLFASDEGLTEYDTNTGTVISLKVDSRQPDGLNDNYLHELFFDREGSLWIGTYFGGVNYVSATGDNYKHYNRKNSQLNARIVSVFAKADNDNLWIGTDDAGFFYWNRQDNTFKSYYSASGKSVPSYHNIHALMQDGDKLYVGMYMGGLDILDLKTGTFKNYKATSSPYSLYSSEVYALYKDKRNQIWVGTTLGLNRYDVQNDKFERIYEVKSADVSCILEDTDDYLWVCSLNNGIFRFNYKTEKWEHFHRFSDKESRIATDQIVTVCKDDRGGLWFGTYGNGLMKYDYKNGNFVKIDLPSYIRVIHKIIADKGHLWLTTNNGLYCYDAATGETKSYNKYDGLQENLFLPNSGIQLSDGTIMVGGINGFNEFHPDKIRNNIQVPTVILTDFQLFNQPVKIGSEHSPLAASITYSDRLTLRHEHSMFSFTAVTLSYTNPSKNLYRYKLEGFEKEWTETDLPPRVTYTNLPAGNYVFRVSASNSDGVWNQDAIALPIQVLPPWWRSMPMIFSYILIFIGSLVYVFYRINRKHRNRIAILTVEKDKEIYQSKIEFFTHIMHEIRTPLTLILAPLENVMQMDGSIKDALPKLQVIERNGKRLLTLVNQLMDFRKIESGRMDLAFTVVDIRTLLANVYQRFQLSAEVKQIELLTTMPDEACYVKVDQEAFTKIVSNLLSNALKFTGSHIWIDLAITPERRVELCVKDDGQGIPAKDREKIFMPFYQVAENRKSDYVGTGIGLSLVKKLVDMMKGELTLESEPGKGTTFVIRFDMAESPEVKPDEALPQVSAPSASSGAADAGRYHILVVDDNQDMRNYLQALLSDYRVTCASDGKEAWELLPKIMPDLIISDVMMPVMSGIQLCRKVKENLLVSHIPVIMLTAKATADDYVEGFESGADIYIEKPFSADVLKAQIASLFKNRERSRREFKSEPMASPAGMSCSKLDSAFMEKVAKIVEERMTDPDFTVDILAQEAGISRSGLFNKLKAIAGMTPNDYVRLIRLKKAAVLLAEEGLSSSEACFQVGFSSPSYFAKCFQTQFGVSPTEFRKKYTAQ